MPPSEAYAWKGDSPTVHAACRGRTACGRTIKPSKGWETAEGVPPGKTPCRICRESAVVRWRVDSRLAVVEACKLQLAKWCEEHLPEPLTIEHILGDSRRPFLVRYRQAAMAHLRRLGFSYPLIGEAMGRDHSTIINGVKRAEAREAA